MKQDQEQNMEAEMEEPRFAVLVERGREGTWAKVYRKDAYGEYQRICTIQSMPYTFVKGILQQVLGEVPKPGKRYPLDEEWGIRLTAYGLATQGLRNPDRVWRSIRYFIHNDDYIDLMWWVGLILKGGDVGRRALRALRVMTELS